MKKGFGSQLKAARKASGYTQTGLAKMIGVSGNTVARAERGLSGLEWPTLERLIDVLGQPATYFFDLKQVPKKLKKPAKLVLFERIAPIDDDQAKLLLTLVEDFLAGYAGQPGGPFPSDPTSDEGEESGSEAGDG